MEEGRLKFSCIHFTSFHIRSFTFYRFILQVKLRVEATDTSATFCLTHNYPKYLERNLAQENWKDFFPLKYAILSFGKRLYN